MTYKGNHTNHKFHCYFCPHPINLSTQYHVLLICHTPLTYLHGLREVHEDHEEVLDQKRQADEEGYDTNSDGEVAGIGVIIGTIPYTNIEISEQDLIRHTAKYNNGEKLEEE